MKNLEKERSVMFLLIIINLIFGYLALNPGYGQEKATIEEASGVEQETTETTDSVGFIGIYITENETGSGVKVDEVIPDCPAAKAGIKKGDIIIEVGGKKVLDEEFLLQEIAKTKPGQKVNFKINRRGKIISVSVETTIRPKPTKESQTTGLIDKIAKTLRGHKDYLGIKICDIVAGLDEYFGVEDGVLILEVFKNSLAEKIGLRPGDVIIGIDDSNIPDCKTLKNTLSRKEPNVPIAIKLIRHKKPMTVKALLTED
ncbi:MAG: PDZ domain-containing protein [candidate division WOR-3 bacterium]